MCVDVRELEVSAVLLSPCQRQLEQISVCGVFLFAILPAAVSALASHVAEAADGICRVGVDFHAQPLAQNGFAFPQSKEDGLELSAIVRLRLSLYKRCTYNRLRAHCARWSEVLNYQCTA